MLFVGFFAAFEDFLSKKRAKTGLFEALFWHFRAKNRHKTIDFEAF